MELLIAGKTSKEIAVAMNVSVRTVEGHRRLIFSTMDVSSAAQLVRTVLGAREARARRFSQASHLRFAVPSAAFVGDTGSVDSRRDHCVGSKTPPVGHAAANSPRRDGVRSHA
jgi:hypothetical protein